MEKAAVSQRRLRRPDRLRQRAGRAGLERREGHGPGRPPARRDGIPRPRQPRRPPRRARLPAVGGAVRRQDLPRRARPTPEVSAFRMTGPVAAFAVTEEKAGGVAAVAEPAGRRGVRRRLRSRPGAPTLPGYGVRRLRPRAVLRPALRLLRLRHLDRPPPPHGGLRRGLRHRPDPPATPRSPSRRPRASSSAAARRRCSRPSCWSASSPPSPAGPTCEVTVECNPDTVTPELLAAYRAGGVNRLSFGVQSMAPHVLAALGRTHDPAGRRTGRRRGPGRRVRQLQPRPHLRRRRASRRPTGGRPSRRPWPSTRPTSAPTPSPSRPAPRSPAGSTPATWPPPTTTTRPTSTWRPTPP